MLSNATMTVQSSWCGPDWRHLNGHHGRTSEKDDTMPTAIRKAVIPAAGLGSRLLPLTKAIPKEMLPVGDKPVIEHTVRTRHFRYHRHHHRRVRRKIVDTGPLPPQPGTCRTTAR